MKKNLLFILLAFLSMSLKANTKETQTTNILNSFSQPREIAISAYVQVRNEWVKGFVFLVDGFVTRCQFPNIQVGGGSLRAQMYQKEKPGYLNPNNPIAINNNFTHYVDIPNYGRAYFTM
jgi:hypothetical protein